MVSNIFLFSPRKLGKMSHYDLRIFFRWVAENHHLANGWQVPTSRKKVSAIACEIARIHEVNCRGLEQQDVGFCWLFVLGWFGFGFGVSCLFVCLSWQLFSKKFGKQLLKLSC